MTPQLYRTYFPYCIEFLANNRAIILNRKYKPLGIESSDRIEYETHPSTITLTLDRETAARLSWDGMTPENMSKIWLYKDACAPRTSDANLQAYLERLAILMLLSHKQAR